MGKRKAAVTQQQSDHDMAIGNLYGILYAMQQPRPEQSLAEQLAALFSDVVTRPPVYLVLAGYRRQYGLGGLLELFTEVAHREQGR